MDKNLHEIMVEMKQIEEPEESLGPARKGLRRQALIKQLIEKLNTNDSAKEREAMIHEYIRGVINDFPQEGNRSRH